MNQRLIISSLALTFIALLFWTGSRYPDLNSKSSSASNITLSDPIGFDALLEINPQDSVFKRVLYTTINWVDNNKKGMIFGLLLAAGLLTVIGLFEQRQFKHRFSNLLLGIGIGAPLGVCVNCAVPVAYGLNKSRMRLETTLAAMFSSPTLNIIVLSILFSVFPFYIALLKLVFSLLFLLVFLPLLIKFFFKDIANPSLPDSKLGIAACPVTPMTEGVRKNLYWFVRQYTKNLWMVVKFTVPLMLLAGFLGALLISLVPWESVIHYLEGLSQVGKLAGLAFVALFGLFLPVPIAFDVLLSANMADLGLPMMYVISLLFSMGIFSIYPFFVIGRYISWKLAWGLTFTLLLLSVLIGIIGHKLTQWDQVEKLQLLTKTLVNKNKLEVPPVIPKGRVLDELIPQGDAKALYLPLENTNTSLKITQRPFLPAIPNKSAHQFQRINGLDIGFLMPIELPIASKYYNLMTTFSRGMAAGDIHNDGWQDVVMASPRGIQVYANIQGKHFSLQKINLPAIEQWWVLAVALVDLNNDGWLDIVLTTFFGGNYVIYNDKGDFDENRLQQIPLEKFRYTISMAFGDIDQNGKLDIVFGNHWNHRWLVEGDQKNKSDLRRNTLLKQKGDQWEVEELSGTPGITLSLLLSDLNNDQQLDLMVGNDFNKPDILYYGEKGHLIEHSQEGHFKAPTTRYTMSIDSADINNDLKLDIFQGQVSNRDQFQFGAKGLRTVSLDKLCSAYQQQDWKATCENQVFNHALIVDQQNIASCDKIQDERQRNGCISLKLRRWLKRTRDTESCIKLLPLGLEKGYFNCFNIRKPGKKMKRLLKGLPQQTAKQFKNTLFMQDPSGDYIDVAKEWSVEVSGWVWNAQFADLDNDEWQDLIVMNGFYPRKARESNYYFHNEQGKTFSDQTIKSGLEDYLVTNSSVMFDFDHDGDLDVLTLPIDAPPFLYRNELVGNNSIAFELRDQVGNHFAIGSQVIIHYGQAGERHQIREIKASGGYQSFNPASVAFGLGDYEKIQKMEVIWSTGEKQEIPGPFSAGSLYRIERTSGALHGH